MSDTGNWPKRWHRGDYDVLRPANFTRQFFGELFSASPTYTHNHAVWLGYFRHRERIDRLCPHVRSRTGEGVYPDIRVMTRRDDLDYRSDVESAQRRLRALLIAVRVGDTENVAAKGDARRVHERTLERCPCRRCRR